ncbi:protein SSUH2 homolog isoform X2 [Montipora capricornis]|uniref:protein SSUH2 homolog isoform X2 n=1 Tax=Montipora capricornis TaxID=246305 RepID=UPI0035F1EBAE
MKKVPYSFGGAQPGQPIYPAQHGYPPQQQGYGAPPLQQKGYGGPPPRQQGYGVPAPMQAGYGAPRPQQPGYGAPLHQQQGYRGPHPQQQRYGAPFPQKQAFAATVGQQPGMQPAAGQFGLVPPQGNVQAPSYTGSDVPDQDVDDNDENAAPPPTTGPPPPDMFGTFAGYENTSFGTDSNMPPPPYEPPKPQETPEQSFTRATAITEQQARDALLAFVSENFCFGKKAARDMDVKDVAPSSGYHYKIWSFCESRTSALKYEPYSGQFIDGPKNGPAPQPWDIPARPAQLFTPQEAHIEVPHTASVKPCFECKTNGYKHCYSCSGGGRVFCNSCGGKGHITVYQGPGSHERRTCGRCHGSGRRICYTCSGDGRVVCWVCQGQCKLKMFIQLTVKWETHEDDHVTERTDLPDHLILASQGTDVFAQELPRVHPITMFHDQDVNAGSQALVEAHSRNWPTKRIVMQRHTLRAVPVSEVKYQWKNTNTRFWVYGMEHKVHAPDYPQQCCCGCILL